jgi:hypothetical protein
MNRQTAGGGVTAVLSTTSELNDDTRLLLRLLRQWLFGMRNGDPEFWQHAWNDLAVRYGAPRARRALVAVERFYKVLADGACRSLSIRPVQCSFLGVDEGVMLLLLRRAGAGDGIGAVETAAGLVHSDAAPELADAARQLHAAFGASDNGDAGSFVAGGWLSEERQPPSTSYH